MADGRQQKRILPAAEFYMLGDERSEKSPDSGMTHRYRQYDDDPSASEALRQRQRASWRAMDPSWHLGKRSPVRLRDGRDFPLAPDLLPQSAAFRAKAPKVVPHYDTVRGYGFDPIGSIGNDWIHIVSTPWKHAIESVERGVHEFIPFELRFKGGVKTSHFLFRSYQYLDLVDFARSDANTVVTYEGSLRAFLPTVPRFVAAKRDVVSGHHWMQHLEGASPYGRPFVSRVLAVLLYDLLPCDCFFFPVALT